ncbi:hypothetical protein EYC58_01445 [Candidatus Saccharibacteria bacterium]|nr:MAG: hypothetical protein EYC58_01445 [Candidatus Saccharibacteria bacterium]
MKRVKILFRRTGLLAVALALAVQAFAVVAPASAASGTATWTGAAGDHKFSTAGNWAGNTLPVAGNTLVFNTAPAGDGDETIDNDISAVFGGLTMSATTGGNKRFLLSNDLSLENGAIIQRTAYQASVGFVSGKGIVGQGGLTFTSSGQEMWSSIIKSMAGVLTINHAQFYGHVPAGATGLVIENEAEWRCSALNITTPVTLGGNGGPGIFHVGGCSGVGGSDPVVTITFSNITLQANSMVGVYTNDIVNVTDLTTNGYTLTRLDGADGTLNTPAGSQSTTYTEKTTQLDGDTGNSSDYRVIVPKETAYLNGKRDFINVREGGTLKGNGSAKDIQVMGTIAPGNSPGKITVTDTFVLGDTGVYQAEILNKDSYDQILAGDVSLNGALDLSFLPGGSVTQGDTFTIISNTGTNPVNGEFSNLAQGAQITVGGATFSINYQGGDGNDVVLTAINTATAPGAPNTGFFAPTLANPVVIALLGLGSMIVLLIVRKQVRR